MLHVPLTLSYWDKSRLQPVYVVKRLQHNFQGFPTHPELTHLNQIDTLGRRHLVRIHIGSKASVWWPGVSKTLSSSSNHAQSVQKHLPAQRTTDVLKTPKPYMGESWIELF